MEEYASRKTPPGMGFPRRSSTISLRNQTNEDRINQYNSRPESSSRLDSAKAKQVEPSEKLRQASDLFRYPSTKIASTSSSKTLFRKSREEKQKLTFLRQKDVAESSSRRAEMEYAESGKRVVVAGEDVNSDSSQTETEDSLSVSTTDETQMAAVPDSAETPTETTEPLDMDGGSNSRPIRRREKEIVLGKPEGCTSSFVHRSTMSRNSAIGTKSFDGIHTGAQRRGLKTLGCASISDALPSRCYSSDSTNNRSIESMRKRTPDGEGSSRTSCLNTSSGLGYPSPRYTSTIPGPSVSTSERLGSQERMTRMRNLRDNAVSVRTRRASNRESQIRMSEEREDNIMLPMHGTITRGSEVERARFSMDEVVREGFPRQFPVELPHAIYSSRHQGSSTRSGHSRPSSRPEESIPEMFHGFVGDRHGYRRVNMEGIAEVLLALDRIEQDEDLTYEQLLVLETNLFLGGVSFHDQHRDMRMDIDNMSYEELLVLEEKMGTVSTALSEEQFVKCVKKCIYMPPSLGPGADNPIEEDIKCSICQEEYVEGEEVGRLGCEHQYHVNCIHQWLKEKKWCPVCKIPAILDK